MKEDNWEIVVKMCYDRTKDVVNEETKRDNTQWGTFVVFNKLKWEQLEK
jgi:hypothetical protein